MYKVDDHLIPWINKFEDYYRKLRADDKDPEFMSFKITYETSIEIYLSIVQPSTTRSIKAILTRSLIECYADIFAVFRGDDPLRQAKKYTQYARKMTRLFNQQSADYKAARDRGEVTRRPFALARKYQSCWNGMDVTTRIESIDDGKHVIGFYEFFSIFAHVNPSRQVYLAHFEDSMVADYHGYLMLIILQTFAAQGFIPEEHYLSLNKIATDYTSNYLELDSSPPYPEAK